MILAHPARATTPLSLTALESSRCELIYLHSSTCPSLLLLATRHSPLATFFHPMFFQSLAHSFARTKNLTPSPSTPCALFCNYGGGGCGLFPFHSFTRPAPSLRTTKLLWILQGEKIRPTFRIYGFVRSRSDGCPIGFVALPCSPRPEKIVRVLRSGRRNRRGVITISNSVSSRVLARFPKR
jgi:hypothetical protein